MTKSLQQRSKVVVIANMPFAGRTRGVASRLEPIGNGLTLSQRGSRNAGNQRRQSTRAINAGTSKLRDVIIGSSVTLRLNSRENGSASNGSSSEWTGCRNS